MNIDPYADLLLDIEEPPDVADWPTPLPAPPVTLTSPVGSVASVGPVGYQGEVLDRVRKWFGRFVLTVHDADLDVLTLWAAHTHLAVETYTTPRLVIDSPIPGAGKTTVLDHLSRLCLRPVQAASLSSPAMLARLLDRELRTILIDEVDRNLNPKRDGVEDLIAVLNAGYKRGATRPVLVPTKDGWDVREMPTFAPVAMAGNAPNLPEDTRSRTIRVLLLPDLEGRVEASDWEEIEIDAADLGAALAEWAEMVREAVRTIRPPMPDGCIGRSKERWAPLRRVAEVAGGRWPETADALIHRDLHEAAMDREDGMVTTPPAVALLRDIYEVWTPTVDFIPTSRLVPDLIAHNPRMWGAESPYGKALTFQRLGRMLAQGFKVNSSRQGDGPRGYYRQSIAPVWRRMGVLPPGDEPTGPTEPVEPTAGGHQ